MRSPIGASLKLPHLPPDFSKRVEPRGLPGREIDDGDPQAIVSDVTQFLLSEITVYPPFSIVRR
jgi:hypothetical protein